MTDADLQNLNNRLEKIENNLSVLLRVIVVQQKDAASIAGVTDDTVRNKFKRGEIDILSRDGSRLNFLTLETTQNLKRRSSRK